MRGASRCTSCVLRKTPAMASRWERGCGWRAHAARTPPPASFAACPPSGTLGLARGADGLLLVLLSHAELLTCHYGSHAPDGVCHADPEVPGVLSLCAKERMCEALLAANA